MMSEGNPPNIVVLLEPGHVMECGAADGNKATNPNNTHESDDSDKSESNDNLDTLMALDKQIARAI